MINERLNKLREEMKINNIDVYFMTTGDDHLSEYVSEYYQSIKYFSGFTGSLATFIIDLENAYLFVDGRYHLQAENQCGKYNIQIMKLGLQGVKDPITFLKENYHNCVALDGKRISIAFAKDLNKRGIKIIDNDIYSIVFENRPAFPNSSVYELNIKYTGKSRKQKLNDIFYCLDGKCLIINNLESIAYALNLRGSDVPCTPVFLAHLIFFNNEVYFFVDLNRFEPELLENLYDDGVIVRPYESFYEFLRNIRNQEILLDYNKVNYNTYLGVKTFNKTYNMTSIIDEFKTIKNEVEINNARYAHELDGASMIRFIKWIKENDLSNYNEYDIAMKLKDIRLSNKAIDESFKSIVGYNDNAAIMHYMPTKDNAKMLENKGILLVDSGGQYLEGTTDITRVISLGEVKDEIKRSFTIVLKSMFNLSETIFLQGTTGRQLDIIARKDIWENNLDYRHGTGHGVGQYLSVHDSPPRINNSSSNLEDVIIKEGQIVSDEPGLYFNNDYGIRCENLILCQKHISNEYGQFLKFETLTLVPFDLDLIDKNYLDLKTIDIINKYHQEVRRRISPYLNDEEVKFLNEITREI